MSMWGEDHDRKTAQFDEMVEAIELKYFHLFENEKSPISSKAPDKLHNHFLTTWDSHKRTIGFSKHTYVPKYIQDEVIEAWKSVFSAK